MSTDLKILVTGGGTGGHVSPAMATIAEIQHQAKEQTTLCAGQPFQPTFLYIGSKAGLERKMATQENLPYVAIETGKLRRYFSLRTFVDALRVPLGVLQAIGHVGRYRPAVVLSTGGYVSVPPVVAGWLWRRPVVIHEQTVTIGLANKINAFFATRIALSFAGALDDLPKRTRHKAVVTGVPVRKAIFGGEPVRAIEFFGLADNPDDTLLPTLYVTGGAQGARVINRAIEDALPDLVQRCRIIHQCGTQPEGTEQDYDRLTARAATLPENLRHRYAVTRFIGDEINDIFALADLVVSRSGAGTVTEISALGKPALFVPLVPTGGDEQTRNARRSVEVGAAVIVTQADLTGSRLRDAIFDLISDRNKLQDMGRNALALATPNATHDLAKIVIELGCGKTGKS